MPFLKNFFDKVSSVWKSLFKKAEGFLRKEIPIAITVVNVIKDIVDNPMVQFAEKWLPAPTRVITDKVLAKLHVLLPKLAIELKLVGECANLNDNNAIIQCLITELQKVLPEKRRGFYLTLASEISMDLTDGKLSFAEIVKLVQEAYDQGLNKHIEDAKK